MSIVLHYWMNSLFGPGHLPVNQGYSALMWMWKPEQIVASTLKPFLTFGFNLPCMSDIDGPGAIYFTPSPPKMSHQPDECLTRSSDDGWRPLVINRDIKDRLTGGWIWRLPLEGLCLPKDYHWVWWQLRYKWCLTYWLRKLLFNNVMTLSFVKKA